MTGVPPAGGGDDHLHAAHRAVAVHMEEEALRFHFGKSDNREITIWDEGIYIQSIHLTANTSETILTRIR